MKLRELQGLRGVAIVLVMAFHFTVRWSSTLAGTSLYPWGDYYQRFLVPLAAGKLGVELFFIISGFVIAQSLERSASARTFVANRFSRLWPPLLLALPVAWAFLQLSPNFGGGSRKFEDLIFSFTLVDPRIANEWLPRSMHLSQTTGVLWSLWIELTFYALAALLYFLGFSLLRALAVVAGFLSAFSVFVLLAKVHLPVWLDATLSLRTYIWWFVAGASAYALRQGRGRFEYRLIYFLALLMSTAALHFGKHVPSGEIAVLITNLLCFCVVYLVVCQRGTAWLRSAPLVAIGDISYELYLVHEAVGMSLLQLASRVPSLHSPAAILLPIIATLVLANFIYRFWSLRACRMVRNRLLDV